jgi:hypothetical protein
MINQHSLDAITNAMRLLSTSGARLNPVKGSAIDMLNIATNAHLVYNTNINDEEFFAGFQASTGLPRPASEGAGYLDGENTGVGILNIDDHEATLHDLRKTYERLTEGLLSFSRNNMQSMLNRVLKNFNPVEEAELTESWTIVPLVPEKLLIEPLVETLLAGLTDLTGVPQYIEPIQGLNVPEGLPLPETGSASYNGMVTQLLKELGETPSGVLAGLARGDAVSPAAPRAYELVRRRVLELLLIAYFHDHPWEGSGLRLIEWEYKTRNCMHQIIAWIKRYIECLLVDASTGLIIRSYDVPTRTVFIIDTVLEDYVQRGGVAEAIYGLIYLREDGDSRFSGSVENVLAEQAKLLESWERHAIIRRKENRDDWRTINSRALKDAFRVAISSEETSDEDLRLGEGRTRDTVMRDLFQRIDIFVRAVAQDVDLTSFVIELIGDAFVEPVGAKLLERIHQVKLAGGNAEEAATDWMIDYVLDGLLDEVDIDFQAA